MMMARTMTPEETLKFERLRAAFSSLDEENKRFTLDISRALLGIQPPPKRAGEREALGTRELGNEVAAGLRAR